MVLRDARIEDAPEIARLTEQLGYSPPPEHVVASLRRNLAREDGRIVIAELDGRAVGWVHVVVNDYVDVERYALIAALVVDSSIRRAGVGRALMARAEEWARQQGVGVMRLTSSSTRTGAHRFYERIGYSNIKTQYSFAKAIVEEASARLDAFVPKVEKSE